MGYNTTVVKRGVVHKIKCPAIDSHTETSSFLQKWWGMCDLFFKKCTDVSLKTFSAVALH